MTSDHARMQHHLAALIAERDLVAVGDAETRRVVGVQQHRRTAFALRCPTRISVKLVLRKLRAGEVIRRNGRSGRRLVDRRHVVGQARHDARLSPIAAQSGANANLPPGAREAVEEMRRLERQQRRRSSVRAARSRHPASRTRATWRR